MALFKKVLGTDKDQGPAEGTKPAAAQLRHLTDEEFDQQVLQSEQAVVVDFWAEWCGPCHAIAPAVEKLADEYAGRALVAKINADDYPEILSRYGIMGIPTLLYFKGGKEVDRIVGYTNYGALKTKMDRLVG